MHIRCENYKKKLSFELKITKSYLVFYIRFPIFAFDPLRTLILIQISFA